MKESMMINYFPEEKDRYYFYSASFDPIYLIRLNALKNQTATQDYFTNAFGVLIRPEYFPTILQGTQGTVEEIPIPANWHADIAEFGAAFRAVELSGETFTMIELGCGWGCWMNITGKVAKRKGKAIHLYGIEGDKGHVEFAKDALAINGFTPSEYKIIHGVASAQSGVALFPVQDQPGVSWGEEPVFYNNETDAEKLMATGNYLTLTRVPLSKVDDTVNRIDLLHVDIQGGELELIPNSIDYLSKTVAYILIGTHSRYIEGIMFDVLTKAGWILEIDRPAVLGVRNRVELLVDGVQGWRNPNLLSDETTWKINYQGKIEVHDFPSEVHCNSQMVIPATIYNDTTTYWGEGRYPIRVSYHWLDNDGKMVVFDGYRTQLGQNGSGLVPEGFMKLGIHVTAPSQPGNYQLQITLVQEGVTWFNNRDFIPYLGNITIEP
jgi:hypothetical protein